MSTTCLNPYRWLSPPGKKGRLTIFIFHRVLARPDPLLPDEPDALHFEQIVKFIARYFNVLSVGESARQLESASLPAAAAAITFDDGYADNLKIAAPILKRHGLTATFFIATGYTDGGRMWNDTLLEAIRIAPQGELDFRNIGLGQHFLSDDDSRLKVFTQLRDAIKYRMLTERAAVTDEIAAQMGLGSDCKLMMTRSELSELKNMGMEIGGHTVMHPILSKLDSAKAATEIIDGREHLAQWLGEPPEVFAYPNGSPGRDYTRRDVELVKAAGYRAAVAVKRGYSNIDSDLFQLPRFTPWDRNMLRFALRCGLNLVKNDSVTQSARPTKQE